MANTPITAEAIFDKHAVALGFAPLGDQDFQTYLDSIKVSHLSQPKADEVVRQLTAAYDAAKVLDHAGVASGIYQARNIQNNPYPPQFGA